MKRLGSILLVAVFLLAAGCVARRSLAPVYYTGERALRLGNFQEAIDAYQVFLRDPGARGQAYVPRSYYMLALAHYQQGEYEEALAALDELELVKPAYGRVQVAALRGDVNRRIGSPVAAIQNWDEAWRFAGPMDRQRLRRRIGAALKEMNVEEMAEAEKLVSEPPVHDLVVTRLVAAGGALIQETEEGVEEAEAGIPAGEGVELGLGLGVENEEAEAGGAAAEVVKGKKPRGLFDRLRAATAAGGRETSAAPAPQPVVEAAAGGKIAYLAPLSGPEAVRNGQLLTAIQLAFGEQPERVVAIDTGPSVESLGRAWARARRDPRILAVLAPADGRVAAELALLARTSWLPLILLTSRDVATGPFVRRWGMTPAEEVDRLLDYAVGKVQVRRFAVVQPQTPAGQHYADLFAAGVRRRGGKVVGFLRYQPGHAEWRKELEQLRRWRHRDVNLEAVFIPDREANVAAFVLGINTRFPDMIILGLRKWNRPGALAPEPWLRAFVADSFFAGGSQPGSRQFAELYAGSTGRQPGSAEAEAYDAAAVLAAGVMREGAQTRADARLWLDRAPGMTARVVASPPLVLRISHGKVEDTALAGLETSAQSE